jgi:hypothetical protein
MNIKKIIASALICGTLFGCSNYTQDYVITATDTIDLTNKINLSYPDVVSTIENNKSKFTDDEYAKLTDIKNNIDELANRFYILTGMKLFTPDGKIIEKISIQQLNALTQDEKLYGLYVTAKQLYVNAKEIINPKIDTFNVTDRILLKVFDQESLQLDANLVKLVSTKNQMFDQQQTAQMIADAVKITATAMQIVSIYANK